jgi:hypothetical protein
MGQAGDFLTGALLARELRGDVPELIIEQSDTLALALSDAALERISQG